MKNEIRLTVFAVLEVVMINAQNQFYKEGEPVSEKKN